MIEEDTGDIVIRREGHAGRVTLNRPDALNALTHPMCRALDAALVAWADDPGVRLVVIDAAGHRAFCAGGDIAQLYAEGRAGNFGHGRAFWRDEYRMNDRIRRYPKPVVAFMQGFTMGGGVGVGCHARHRITGESSQIAMPECGIGLVPDVGGSFLLAHAPGRLGAFLGTTGTRMGPADAILAGFADHFVPEADWSALIADLCDTGEAGLVAQAARPAPPGRLAERRPTIDRLFAPDSLSGIRARLDADPGPVAAECRAALDRVSPLAAAAFVEILRRLGPAPTMRAALDLEFRFTWRAQEETDFLEGIRAAVIDKDRTPRWRHAGAAEVPAALIDHLLSPLGADALTFPE